MSTGKVPEAEENLSCIVTFDAGGGTGKMEPVSLEPGTRYKLPECKFTPPEGKAFAGWLIGKPGETPKPDGAAKTDTHKKDEEVVIDVDTVLKAQWKDAGEAAPSETGSVFGGGGIAAAGYFHLKHLMIPDVDYGVVRCQRGYNALGLCMGL